MLIEITTILLSALAQIAGEYSVTMPLAGIAGSLHNLGVIAQDQGEYAEARRLYQQSLEIFERLRSPYAETTRRNLARLEDETGDRSET
jgi:Tfp pilus assembly protein PilF